MKNTVTNDSDIPQSVKYFQYAVYPPTLALGLIFNMLALWIACCKIRKWTESRIYILTLITLDTLLLFTLPFKIKAFHDWKTSLKFCKVLESMYFVNMYGSIIISTCICLDRFICINHPFLAQSLRSPKKATLICLAVYIIVSGGNFYTLRLHGDDTGSVHCFQNFSSNTWKSKFLLITPEVIFFGCLSIMVVCTIRIIICLWRSSNLSGRVGNNRSVMIVGSNLLSYVICYMPYHVTYLLYFLKKNTLLADPFSTFRPALQISQIWANLHCCLNAICYYFVFKEALRIENTETYNTQNSKITR
ncbi:G-protein coupled receptor 35-like [Ornithorhynchus anatinus]|uniref:G-protein coupled receptors family 1 profile domain-containing protein n=1 Tax=Ornithorhynchus anatinus TaxID=9258 RepID=F6XFE1_ORNAN|nr:G-protein coupled receptor 35-like [Ornithorhynchus anatinus]